MITKIIMLYESTIKCGVSPAWFKTLACHVRDPGSNPGRRISNRGIVWLLLWPSKPKTRVRIPAVACFFCIFFRLINIFSYFC